MLVPESKGSFGRNVEELNTQNKPDSTTPGISRSGAFRFFVDLVETAILSIVLFIGINLISARIRVDGTSMEPNLHTGEFVLVNRLAYRLGQPRLGDVIVFYFPRDPGQEYIKRVIGLPGDKIEVKDEQVFVNGTMIQEPYIAAPPNYTGSWSVPAKSLFVLGDNRNNSSDSHAWGAVPMDYVIGKAVFVYWPPTQMGIILHTANAASPGY